MRNKISKYEARLLAAKLNMQAGLNFVEQDIPSHIISSWRRSRSHGILTTDEKLIAADQARYVIDDNDRYLAEVVGDEIEAIWDSFGGDNWVVYCTNSQALIIKAKHGSNPFSKSYAINEGLRIQECDIGTTAPSLALKEKQSLTLTAAEHYLEEFKNMFCCAAPIWGPWGKILGTLNITGSENFRSRLVEKKIQTAAMKIENRLFIDTHKNNQILKIHFDQEFINSHLAGLIAINEFGDILSASRNSLELLEDIDPIHKRHDIGDIFFSDIVPTGQYCLKSTMRNGVVFYIQNHQNDGARPMDFMAAHGVRSGGSVRELSDLHVIETVKRTNGNISKAAEKLGLSRTTIYRVLHRQRGAPTAR